MRSTMQDAPLTVGRIVRYATSVHSAAEVVTFTGDGSRRMSYGELGRRARTLANVLRSLGISGDQRVGSFLWNNAEHLETYAAVPSMGAVLHTLNIRLFPEQLIYITNHAADQVVICDGSLVGLLAPVLDQLKTVRHVLVTPGGDRSALEGMGADIHDYEELMSGADDDFDFHPGLIDDERDTAAMCYTSGTTGNPKGVAYSHRSIYLHSLQGCTAEGFALAQGDRVLAVVPMFHAMAWGLPYAAMMCGADQHMPDRFLQAEPLTRFITAERPTVAGAVPTVWSALLAHLDANPVDVSCLRDVVVGGSACPPAMMKGFEERHNVRLIHAWGMTELSPIGSIGRAPVGLSPEETWARRISQGRLPCAVEGRLVDDDGSILANDGVAVGELEVRGPWVASAYYNNPDMPDDLGEDKFRDGWLRTGDVGTLTPDGYLTLTDRAKDVIKSGGEWISSVDLENSIMGHPAVAEAAVIGIPDPKWDERPLAAVVVRPEASVTFEELRDYLGDKVAKWQLPENWAFIPEVPKTSVGKFDKKVLRARHAAGELDVTSF
ncbi:MAG TPA: long-chain fatty acid--CoA ligase [Sporichthyaceae bacterium]|jgi:fatty-acyl-CoA synthase